MHGLGDCPVDRPPTLLPSFAHSAGPDTPTGGTATPPAGAASRETSGSPATPATPFKNTRLCTCEPPSGGSTIPRDVPATSRPATQLSRPGILSRIAPPR